MPRIPSEPKNLFAVPFADEGNKIITPVSASSGRASLLSGFPTETQLPLSQGGVAPNRLDFNGILHMLSAFAFWQQSGGLFSYNAGLNYTMPCLVYHKGVLWWCLRENGPDAANKPVEPGTDESCWLEFLKALAQIGGVSGLGNPVGTVITFWGTKAPDGYFALDGSSYSVTNNPQLFAVLGSAVLPDLRGYFIRGYDTRNTVDPEGFQRNIGNKQQDAIRNITGEFFGGATESSGHGFNGLTATGAFTGRQMTAARKHWHMDSSGQPINALVFDAARVVPTASENRPKNVCLLYCIKHD